MSMRLTNNLSAVMKLLYPNAASATRPQIKCKKMDGSELQCCGGKLTDELFHMCKKYCAKIMQCFSNRFLITLSQKNSAHGIM